MCFHALTCRHARVTGRQPSLIVRREHFTVRQRSFTGRRVHFTVRQQSFTVRRQYLSYKDVFLRKAVMFSMSPEKIRSFTIDGTIFRPSR